MRRLAHAFLRTASENSFKDIEKLEYIDEDVEFVLRGLGHFIEFKINPLFADWFIERRQLERPRDRVKKLVLDLLSVKEMRQRREIDAQIDSVLVVGPATISNALGDLVLERRICQPKYGFYKLKEDCWFCKHQQSCMNKDIGHVSEIKEPNKDSSQ